MINRKRHQKRVTSHKIIKKLELGNNIKNKVKAIYDSKVYTNKVIDKLLYLYYYTFQKNHNKSENK